jgi:hypothetical protein
MNSCGIILKKLIQISDLKETSDRFYVDVMIVNSN